MYWQFRQIVINIETKYTNILCFMPVKLIVTELIIMQDIYGT